MLALGLTLTVVALAIAGQVMHPWANDPGAGYAIGDSDTQDLTRLIFESLVEYLEIHYEFGL